MHLPSCKRNDFNSTEGLCCIFAMCLIFGSKPEQNNVKTNILHISQETCCSHTHTYTHTQTNTHTHKQTHTQANMIMSLPMTQQSQHDPTELLGICILRYTFSHVLNVFLTITSAATRCLQCWNIRVSTMNINMHGSALIYIST